MPLPSLESVQSLLSTGGALRRRILTISKRLVDLNEYSPEQALRVAADIVKRSIPNHSKQGELT